MYTKGDFHIHTSASDGKLKPSDLIFQIKAETDVDIIAITDHDTTSGIDNAIIAGKKAGIKVIPGIELSTIYNNESIHILGYFKDQSYKCASFQNFLKDLKEHRIYRSQKIIENLYTFFNISLDYKKISDISKGVIARPHIARAIIDAGYPYSWDYIFEHIISKDSPAYVHNKKVSVSEGVKLLKSVNAFVSLAHPVLIKKSPIDELLRFNFDGMEAIYYLNSSLDTENLIHKCQEHHLFITAGSDFHGITTDDSRHGNIGSSFLTGEPLFSFLKELSIFM